VYDKSILCNIKRYLIGPTWSRTCTYILPFAVQCTQPRYGQMIRYRTLYRLSWSASSIVLRRKRYRGKNTEKEEDSRRVLRGRPRRARPMANGRPKIQVNTAAIKLTLARTPGPPQHGAVRCILLFYSFLFSPLLSSHFLPPAPLVRILYIMLYNILLLRIYYNNWHGTHIRRARTVWLYNICVILYIYLL